MQQELSVASRELTLVKAEREELQKLVGRLSYVFGRASDVTEGVDQLKERIANMTKRYKSVDPEEHKRMSEELTVRSI